MNNQNQNTNPEPGFFIRPGINFEDYFNKDTVCPEKIDFARYYIEDKMGYDLSGDSLIDFSAIGIKLFGCLVADIVLEYENFKRNGLDG